MSWTNQWIPPGPAGTALTLNQMATLIRRAALLEIVRQTAVGLSAPPLATSPAEFLEAVDQFCRQYVVVVDEAEEMLFAPELMLAQIQQNGRAFGDCDDVTDLGLSLMSTMGIECRLVGFQPGGMDRFSHVFGECFIGGQWVRFDPTIDPHTFFPAGTRMTVDI